MRVSVEQGAPDAFPRAGSWKFGYAVLLALPTMKRPHEMFGAAEETLALTARITRPTTGTKRPQARMSPSMTREVDASKSWHAVARGDRPVGVGQVRAGPDLPAGDLACLSCAARRLKAARPPSWTDGRSNFDRSTSRRRLPGSALPWRSWQAGGASASWRSGPRVVEQRNCPPSRWEETHEPHQFLTPLVVAGRRRRCPAITPGARHVTRGCSTPPIHRQWRRSWP